MAVLCADLAETVGNTLVGGGQSAQQEEWAGTSGALGGGPSCSLSFLIHRGGGWMPRQSP